MSSSETESSSKDKITTKNKKFVLKKLSELDELQPADVRDYIEQLHELLYKRKKKLKKYREKIKQLREQLQQANNNKSTALEESTTSTGAEPASEETHASAVCNFVNDIRQAAEQAQNLNGFVYEPTSGLYYDQKTGYYYNAEYGLYYDGNTGSYYHYNQEKNEFEFHSQVQTPQHREKSTVADSADNLTNYVNNSLLNRFSNLNFNRMRNNALDIAKKYPPSLRIIVQETNVSTIKVGSLNLITFKGGTLGREGKHDVIIPDVNVSKTHLKFNYDNKQCVYKCIDVGSRNGTILNGTRMSVTKTESVAHNLVHGSVIQIGQTKLLCHVHEGNSTCGLCEPGLLIETAREQAASSTPTVVLSHKEQLKMLQKKYGLEHEKFVENKQNVGNYNDRAATRRIQVGSTTDGEKTQTASVNTEISSENKGFKMLAKLGWSRGEALGKVNDGTALLEPINVTSNEGKKGLGCDERRATSIKLSNADKRKIENWKKTQQRYQKTDIFEDSGESA